MRKPWPIIGLALILACGAILRAEAFASFEAARELVSVLDELRLNAIATVDPTEGGAFVAALYIPRRQLAVVRASHPSVEDAMERIGQLDMGPRSICTPTGETRRKVLCAGCRRRRHSQRPSRQRAVDVLYKDGGRQTLFNGDIKGQRLTIAEYDAKLAATDAEYARLLALLTAPRTRCVGRAVGEGRTGHYSSDNPYSFIFRQSVTGLMLRASAARLRFPLNFSSACRISRCSFCFKSSVSVVRIPARPWTISGGSSRTLTVVPRARMTPRSIACSNSRTLPGHA